MRESTPSEVDQTKFLLIWLRLAYKPTVSMESQILMAKLLGTEAEGGGGREIWTIMTSCKLKWWKILEYLCITKPRR